MFLVLGFMILVPRISLIVYITYTVFQHKVSFEIIKSIFVVAIYFMEFLLVVNLKSPFIQRSQKCSEISSITFIFSTFRFLIHL